MFLSLKSFTQDLIYKHYTTEQGLPHDITYQIIQDQKGFLWIGTDDGLSKFNGKEFKNFSDEGLTSNYVIDIIEDKKEDLFYIATWGGGLHTLKNDSISKLEIKNDKYTKIYQIYKINDSIIFGVSNFSQFFYDVKKKTTKRITLDLKNNKLYPVVKKTGNKIRGAHIPHINTTYTNNETFIFSSNLYGEKHNKLKGIYKVVDQSFEKVIGLPEYNKIIHSFDQKGDLRLIGSNDSLSIFKKGKLLLKKNLKLNGKIIQSKITNNKIYFTFLFKQNGESKIYAFDLKNKRLTNISEKLNIKSKISDFLIDNEKNLWITTYGQGIYQVLNANDSFMDSSYFFNSDLRDITVIDKNVYTIAPNVLYKISSKNKILHKKTPFFSEAIQETSSNDIKIITPFKSKTNFNFKIDNKTITNDIFKEYCFTYEDYKVVLKRSEFFIYKNKKLLKHDWFLSNDYTFINNVIQKKNKIYVAIGRSGIFSLDIISGKIENWSLKKNIKSKYYKDLIIKKDTFWIGTNNGIFKISPEEILHLTKKNGLPSNHINDLFVDNFGKIWIGTSKGLAVYNNNHFYTIGASFGQKSMDIKKIDQLDNFIYAIGNKGLFKYNNAEAFTEMKKTKLIISQNKSKFNINTINYFNPESIQIHYKLNNQKWITTTNQVLDFKNLKQDRYVITFKYKDNLSNWRYSKPYYFKIQFPWYQQTWFYTIITLIVAVPIIALLFFQLKKSIAKNKLFKENLRKNEELQLALKEVRKNIAREFHDELGNKIASISIMSNMLIDENYNTNTNIKTKKLHQIKKDADYLYEGVKDFIWSLDHQNDNLKQLVFYLNDFGENLFENSDIQFYTNNNFISSEITLPFYWSKQIALIFKEAMTNTLKHSQASKVELNFHLQENELKIKLKDNGIGFNYGTIKESNGLQNMFFRSEAIEQKLVIKSEKGTEIIFNGTLNKQK